MGEPLRPYLPAIGRFLIVVTFIEDAIRIITQWNDQLTYLRDFRHIPWGLTHLFLIFNVITMSVCSVLVIMRRYGEYAVGGLLSVVVPSTRIRPYFRSELLPPEPVRHWWPAHGARRQLCQEDQSICWTALDR